MQSTQTIKTYRSENSDSENSDSEYSDSEYSDSESSESESEESRKMQNVTIRATKTMAANTMVAPQPKESASAPISIVKDAATAKKAKPKFVIKEPDDCLTEKKCPYCPKRCFPRTFQAHMKVCEYRRERDKKEQDLRDILASIRDPEGQIDGLKAARMILDARNRMKMLEEELIWTGYDMNDLNYDPCL